MSDKLEIVSFAAGPIETNTYLVIDSSTQHAIVVDAPPDAAGELTTEIGKRGLTVDAIVITHGHWDHIGDAEELRRTTGAPLFAHQKATPKLKSPGSSMLDLGFEIEPVTVDRLIEAGDTVTVGDRTLKVLFLPGHDPGHIALYAQEDGVLISADVLFPNGHGRVDLPDASPSDMESSLRQLMELPDDTVVYTGHGLPTTIGAERPWMPRVQ